MNYSITNKDGKCAKHLCVIDETHKTVITKSSGLVFNFFDGGWTFVVENECVFHTGKCCIFNTIDHCVFNTGPDCTFDTGHYCTFKVGENCTLITGDYCLFTAFTGSCTFSTGESCTFVTGDNCIFDAAWDCFFNVGSCCTFDVGDSCTFKGNDHCFVIRRDKDECFKLLSGVTTRLTEFGYEVKTSEYVAKYMNSVIGLETILSNDEYMVLTSETKHDIV